MCVLSIQQPENVWNLDALRSLLRPFCRSQRTHVHIGMNMFFLTIPCNSRHYSGFPTNRFNVVEKMGLIRRDQCDLAAAISLVLTCGISPATAVDIWWLVLLVTKSFPGLYTPHVQVATALALEMHSV